MHEIREYILFYEAGRPKKRYLSKQVRRQRSRAYRRKRSQIRQKAKKYRKTAAYRKQQRLYKKKYARGSYRPDKRIYH